MSDKFNEESSDAQRRAEKIKAIRRSIHSEAEVAPTTYENKTETEHTESISDRIMRAKEKKMATAADILDELDAAIAYEKAAAARMAEEAEKAAEEATVNASPDISDLLDEFETPEHEELKEIAEEIAGDFTEVADTVTDDVEDFTEVEKAAEDSAETAEAAGEEDIDLEEVFSLKPDEAEEATKVLSGSAIARAAEEDSRRNEELNAAEVISAESEAVSETAEAREKSTEKPEESMAPVNAAGMLRSEMAHDDEHTSEKVTEPVRQTAEAAEPVADKKAHKKKKKKKSFKQRLIGLVPHKGDSVGECVRKIVFLGSITAIIICGYLVGDYYLDLWSSKRKTADIMNIYMEADDPPPEVKDTPKDTRKKYKLLEGARKLLEINPDIVGVVSIPDTPLNNPVLQADDNNKYLRMKYDLTENIAGEIFLDYRNHFDEVDEEGYLKCPNSDNLILYGHDMYDDQMFGFLKYYVRNEAYYGNHAVIDLSSNYEKYQYKIFSFFIVDSVDDTDTKFDCWNKLDFDGEEDFYNFVNEAKRRTIRTNNVDVKYGDELLTLFTCSTYFPDERARLIILARKVRPGEDPLEGTQDSQPNPNIKWPTIYYADHPNEHYDPEAEFVPYGPKGGK